MNVLVLDDDAELGQLVAIIVRRSGHNAIALNDPIDAVARYATAATPIDAVITDMMMPRMDGVAVCKAFQLNAPHVRRIMLTAAPSIQAVREAVTQGIVNILLRKPATIDDIRSALDP